MSCCTSTKDIILLWSYKISGGGRPYSKCSHKIFPHGEINCWGEEQYILLPRGKYPRDTTYRTPTRACTCAYTYVQVTILWFYVQTHTENRTTQLLSNLTWRKIQHAIGSGHPSGMRCSSCWYQTACLKMGCLAVETLPQLETMNKSKQINNPKIRFKTGN